MASAARPPPETCANCGAAIPRTARACPECGADERSGWRESSVYDDLELPDSAWGEDTDAAARAHSARRVKWYWLGAGLLVLIVLVLAALRL